MVFFADGDLSIHAPPILFACLFQMGKGTPAFAKGTLSPDMALVVYQHRSTKVHFVSWRSSALSKPQTSGRGAVQDEGEEQVAGSNPSR